MYLLILKIFKKMVINMIFQKQNLLLYAVTDRKWTGRQTLPEQIEDALKGGATMIQLREKGLEDAAFIDEAITVRNLCHAYHVPLIINDNLHVALMSRADGIHVGTKDLPVKEIRRLTGENFIIGATAKTIRQAQDAEAAGADYLGVGALFPSPTKKTAVRITKEELQKICRSVSIPAVAIGGIEPSNVMELSGSGVCGAAVVSAVFSSKDIPSATAALKDKLTQIVQKPAVKTALSIAGSDSSGGAGIQADLKTMTLNGVYAMSVITALTAQNTTGVSNISEVSPDFLVQQLDAVFSDIFPDAVKIGMISSATAIKTIAEKLTEYKPKHIVLDPVMVSTSGSRLINEDAVDTLKSRLLPLASLLTPNIPEAEVLSGLPIQCREDMICATKQISETCGCAVLCKGGHNNENADDLLYENGRCHWFYGKRIFTPNTHGTGCTLSSAITANLAKGFDLLTAIERGKDYISCALSAGMDLGKGCGPLWHGFDLNSRFAGGANDAQE